MLVFRGVKQKLAKTLSITMIWWWSCRFKKGQLQIMIIVTIQVPTMTIMISMGEHRYHTICILCNYNVRYVEILRECIIFLIPTISNLKNSAFTRKATKAPAKTHQVSIVVLVPLIGCWRPWCSQLTHQLPSHSLGFLHSTAATLC